MEIKVVGEKEFCEVFEFLGVKTFYQDSPQEVLEFLKKQTKDKSLILISQKVCRDIQKEVQEIKLKARKTVILEIPSPSFKEEKEFEVKKILTLISGVKL